MAIIKGLWTFKKKLTLPLETISQKLQFGEGKYQGLVIYQYGIDYILADGSRETLVYSAATGQWKNDEIRRVELGSEEITVSDKFLTWFLENSVKNNAGEVEIGTYRFKDTLTAFPDTEINLYLNYRIINLVHNGITYNFSGERIKMYNDGTNNFVRYYGSLSTDEGTAEIEFIAYSDRSDMSGWGKPQLPQDVEPPSILSESILPPNFGQSIFIIESIEITSDFTDWFNINTNRRIVKIAAGAYKWKDELDDYLGKSIDLTFSIPIVVVDDVEYKIAVNNIAIEDKGEDGWSIRYNGVLTTSEGEVRDVSFLVYNSKDSLWGYGSTQNTDVPWGFGQTIVFDRDTDIDLSFFDWFSKSTEATNIAIIKKGTYKFNSTIYLNSFGTNDIISLPITTSLYVTGDESGARIRNIPQRYKGLRFNASKYGGYNLAITDLDQNEHVCYTSVENRYWNACYDYYSALDPNTSTELKAFGQIITITRNTPVSNEFATWFNDNTTALIKAKTYAFNDIINSSSSVAASINFVSNGLSFTKINVLTNNSLSYINGSTTTAVCNNNSWVSKFYKTIQVKQNTYVSVTFYNWAQENWNRISDTPSVLSIKDKLQELIDKINLVTQKEDKDLFVATNSLIENVLHVPNGTIKLTENTGDTPVNISKYALATVNVPLPTIKDWGSTVTENGWYYPSQINADGIKSINIQVPQKTVGKKATTITANGTYVAQTTDKLDGYSEVKVALPINDWVEKVTTNGTYKAADKGWAGIRSITVEVPQAKVGPRKEKITENKKYSVLTDSANTDGVQGYSEFEVDIPQPTIISWPEPITSNQIIDATGKDWDGINYIEIAVPDTKVGKRKAKIVDNGLYVVSTDPGNTEGVEAYTEFEVEVPQKTIQEEAYVITKSGEYFASDSGVDGYAYIKVDITEGSGGGSGDCDGSCGSGSVVIPEGYLKPTGTKDIFTNGRINIAAYEWVNVMVTGGDGESEVPEYDGRYRITGEIIEETCDCEVFEEYDGRHRISGDSIEEECICEEIPEYDGGREIHGKPETEVGIELEFYDGLITTIDLGGN